MPVSTHGKSVIDPRKFCGHVHEWLPINLTGTDVDLPSREAALRFSVTRQVAVGIGEVGCYRKIDGIKGDLLTLIPRIEVMKDKADGRLDPSNLAHRRITLQYPDIGARSPIESKRGTDFAHAIQIEGQGEYGEQDVVPRDGKIMNHCRIGRFKAFGSLDYAIRADHVIGHGFAAYRARHVAEAMQITRQRINLRVRCHGILKVSPIMTVAR